MVGLQSRKGGGGRIIFTGTWPLLTFLRYARPLYKVIAAAKVRKEFDLNSQFVTQLPEQTRLHVVEIRRLADGGQRVQIIVAISSLPQAAARPPRRSARPLGCQSLQPRSPWPMATVGCRPCTHCLGSATKDPPAPAVLRRAVAFATVASAVPTELGLEDVARMNGMLSPV